MCDLEQESQEQREPITGDLFKSEPDTSYRQIEDDLPLPAGWYARLDELAVLQDGWLDEDPSSLAPTLPALRAARTLLALIANSGGYPRRPGIYPTPRGGISLEWGSKQLLHLWSSETEVEIDAQGRMDIGSFRIPKESLPRWIADPDSEKN